MQFQMRPIINSKQFNYFKTATVGTKIGLFCLRMTVTVMGLNNDRKISKITFSVQVARLCKVIDFLIENY